MSCPLHSSCRAHHITHVQLLFTMTIPTELIVTITVTLTEPQRLTHLPTPNTPHVVPTTSSMSWSLHGSCRYPTSRPCNVHQGYRLNGGMWGRLAIQGSRHVITLSRWSITFVLSHSPCCMVPGTAHCRSVYLWREFRV